jgi:hypothetical protein
VKAGVVSKLTSSAPAVYRARVGTRADWGGVTRLEEMSGPSAVSFRRAVVRDRGRGRWPGSRRPSRSRTAAVAGSRRGSAGCYSGRARGIARSTGRLQAVSTSLHRGGLRSSTPQSRQAATPESRQAAAPQGRETASSQRRQAAATKRGQAAATHGRRTAARPGVETASRFAPHV